MNPFTISAVTTIQKKNAYSKLEEDGTFTPCYVNDKEESVVIPEGSTEKIGRSAIGRRPAVLVKIG